MAAGLTPSIIVLALGAGALGFPDALRLLLLRDVAGRRSPLLDIAVCTVAMAALTAYALGAVLLVRFVRKAGPGAGAGGARRTDPFARLTHAVSLGAAAAVFACLIAEPGACGLALLCSRIVDGATGESEASHVMVSVLVASAAAILACTSSWRPLLRAAPASTPTSRLSVTAQPAAAASTILSSFTRNAVDAGGRAAPTPATTTRRFQAPSQLAVVVSFANLVCLLLLLLVVVTTYTTHGREANGAEF